MADAAESFKFNKILKLKQKEVINYGKHNQTYRAGTH